MFSLNTLSSAQSVISNLSTKKSYFDLTNNYQKSSAIDLLDTVFLDANNAIFAAGVIEFPVYIHSDDVINSLDFSFKYDMTNLDFSAIVDLAPYLQSFAFENPNDSTVRYTSYALQNYALDSNLLKIQFSILNGSFNPNQMNTAKSYLNGVLCTTIITGQSTVGLNDDLQNSKVNFEIYPNPTRENIHFKANNYTTSNTIEILDLTGKVVFTTNTNTDLDINLENLSNGIYSLKYYSEDRFSTKLFVKY
jgi:hypothetical protein